MRELMGFLAVVITVFGGLFGLCVWGDSVSCHAQWDRAGHSAVSFGPVQGCMIQLKDQRWVPADSIRGMQEIQ